MERRNDGNEWNLRSTSNKSAAAVERVLYDERQAGALLGVSGRTIRNMADRGQIPRVRLLSNVRYHIDDLRAFIQSAKQTSKTASERGAA